MENDRGRGVDTEKQGNAFLEENNLRMKTEVPYVPRTSPIFHVHMRVRERGIANIVIQHRGAPGFCSKRYEESL